MDDLKVAIEIGLVLILVGILCTIFNIDMFNLLSTYGLSVKDIIWSLLS